MGSKKFDLKSLTDETLGLTDHFQEGSDQESESSDFLLPRKRATFVERFLFNSDRRPTALSKFFLLRRNMECRLLARRIVKRKNGTIRLSIREWYDLAVAENLGSEKDEFDIDTPEGYIIRTRLHSNAETLHIVTTPHTEFLAAMIKDSLAGTRFTITTSTEMPKKFDRDLYIVACPQMFDRLPPKQKRMIFQLEQSGASQWFTPGYLNIIRDSFAVLDYSIDNIRYLDQAGVFFKKMFYLPIQPIKLERTARVRDIDVLFYGALGKSRRREMLALLGKHHNVRVESNLFGTELEDLLDRAKVVVNIHYYEGALLETTRIAQALSHGAQVVSEVASDQKRNEFFETAVSFVPIGDMESMAAAIHEALRRAQPEQTVRSLESVNPFERTRYMLLRALFACGVISFQELWQTCSDLKLPSDCLILGIPESVIRHDFAREHRLEGAEMFYGLRMIDGWKGCALSYKFLAMLARQQDLPAIAIYEDDAELRTDGVNRLKTVRDYLSRNAGEWDVFTGLLSDLHGGTVVYGVEDFNKERFVKLDRLIGMVFGIYSKEALERISDFRFLGSDTNYHTIDRYLEALPLRCVSLAEPLVDHHEELSSTIWGNENAVMVATIASSQKRLRAKIEEYLTGVVN